MKTVIYSCVFTLVSLWSLVAFGQGSCHNGGGYPGGGYPGGGYPDNGYPGGVGGSPYPEFEQYDIAKGLPYFQKQPPASNIVPISQPKTVAPAGPTAKITLISVNSTDSLAKSKSIAKLTIVPDVVPAEPKTTEVAVEEPPVDERIASLAGTWKAVARRGEGELTTVELRLDDRGWAELIVPGSDGEPRSTKSRVDIENQELRLTDSDRVVSLGKLIEFGSRQMVLERAEGQMTFVKI